MSDQPLTFAVAADELRRLGVILQMVPGEYVVSYAQGGATAPHTDDLSEALSIGRAMAQQMPSAPPLLLGPTGRRNSRRAFMLKHNNKIAARRRAQAIRAAATKPKKRDD